MGLIQNLHPMALPARLIGEKVERDPAGGAGGEVDGALLFNRAGRRLMMKALVEVVDNPQLLQRPAGAIDQFHLKGDSLPQFRRERTGNVDQHRIFSERSSGALAKRETETDDQGQQMTCGHAPDFLSQDGLSPEDAGLRRPLRLLPRRRALGAGRSVAALRAPRAESVPRGQTECPPAFCHRRSGSHPRVGHLLTPCQSRRWKSESAVRHGGGRPGKCQPGRRRGRFSAVNRVGCLQSRGAWRTFSEDR